MPVIYAIKNLVNNKVYIGSSKSPKIRKYEHFYSLKKGKHHSIHLQRSYDKYGKDMFSFYVIEECSDSDRKEREIFFINQFKAIDREFGYNVMEPNKSNFKCSEETKLKILEARKDKISVDLYKTDGTFIGTFPSIKSAALHCGFDNKGHFNRIILGKGRSYKGYTVVKHGEPFTYIKSSKARDMSKFSKR